VLKLLVSPRTGRSSVCTCRHRATELIHIARRDGCGGTFDYLVDAVFNYPTLAESTRSPPATPGHKIRQIERLITS